MLAYESLRFCVDCGKVKIWNEAAKPNHKSSGFMGHSCWACYIESRFAYNKYKKEARKVQTLTNAIKAWHK